MSVHVEWLAAPNTCVDVIAPGEEWVASEHQRKDRHVLALSTDQVTAIEGTGEELRALAARISRAVEALP